MVLEARERAAADVIFCYFDDRLCEGDFAACEATLGAVVLDDFTPMLVVSFLTITKAAAERIPTRGQFVDRARPWLCDKLGTQRADELLRHRA